MTTNIQLIEPLEELKQKVAEIYDTADIAYTTFKEQITEAFDYAREKGISDLEIGNIFRAEQRRREEEGLPVWHRATLASALPSSAKNKPRGKQISRVIRQTGEEPSTTQTEEEEEQEIERQYGKFEIKPKDYLTEDLDKYSRYFLMAVIKDHLDKENKRLMNDMVKFEGQLKEAKEKMSELKKQLKDEQKKNKDLVEKINEYISNAE